MPLKAAQLVIYMQASAVDATNKVAQSLKLLTRLRCPK